jgi:hypothetical protein
MEFRAEARFASPYFVTDASRAISQVVEPAVLVNAGEMTLELLAFGVGELALLQEKAGVSRKDRPARTIGFDAAQEALAQIIDKGVPAKPLVLLRPLLVLSLRLDKAALAPLLIVKMRGSIQTLAVRFTSSSELAAVLDALATCAQPRTTGGAVIVFDGVPKLHVVSGTTTTVLSTDTNCEGILKKYPGIAADKPLTQKDYLFPE